MATSSDRPLRSVYRAGIRRWCAAYAQRWGVPVEELVSLIAGGEIIPYPPEVQARAVRIRCVAERLDALMPAELQWNFWYRPSVCNSVSPMCRLGWTKNCLEEIEGELQSLQERFSEIAPVDADPPPVLRLFKPATMFKRLERGFAVTHVVCEHKPRRYQPLEFAPEDHAPLVSGPPGCALVPPPA